MCLIYLNVYNKLYIQIYPSEFGKERLQMEQSQGPLELLVSLPEDPEKDSEEEKYDSFMLLNQLT